MNQKAAKRGPVAFPPRWATMSGGTAPSLLFDMADRLIADLGPKPAPNRSVNDPHIERTGRSERVEMAGRDDLGDLTHDAGTEDAQESGLATSPLLRSLFVTEGQSSPHVDCGPGPAASPNSVSLLDRLSGETDSSKPWRRTP